VDLVPDPLLLRKSGSAWNRTRTSGSVARNRYACNSEDVRTRSLGSVRVKVGAPPGVTQTPGPVMSADAAPDLAVRDNLPGPKG
jgi:hypothetical protein